MSGSNMVVHKRMSFLSSLVWGVTTIAVTVVSCGAGIAFYTLSVADRHLDGIQDLAGDLISDVPALVRAAPELSDALLGVRNPDYLEDLDVAVAIRDYGGRADRMTPVITIRNNGAQTVTWLTLRVVITGPDGAIYHEYAQPVVTPISLERDCPGPLMPGSTRRLSAGCFSGKGDLTAEYEITDVRLFTSHRPMLEAQAQAN